MNMTAAQARVVDPILTTVVRGHRNQKFVGNSLFPTVPVKTRGGNIIEFGKEHFRLANSARAHGAAVKRIQYGYEGKPYSLKQHALGSEVAVEKEEEAQNGPGISLQSLSVKRTSEVIALDLEYRQAQLARNASNYASSNKITLSGSSQWSHVDSNPNTNFQTAADAIANGTGEEPNLVIIPRLVWSKLKFHPKLLDQFKYTNPSSITTEMLADLWEVEKVEVARGFYIDDSDARQYIWGKDVIVAYVAPADLQDQATPSYGYTYQLEGYPVVEQGYYDHDTRSHINQVVDEVSPVIAGADAAYLMQAVVP